jgi:hypothetical protein
MPALRTRTQIFNDALDILNEQPVAEDSSTKPALWLARNYEQQRDYLLERYYWKFSLTRKLIAADPTSPEWGWTSRYRIPVDSLRIVPPTYDGNWNGTPIDFEWEGQFLLCNITGGLRLRYVSRTEADDANFSNGFCECLALRLAARMAHWMTGKQSMMQEIKNDYRATLMEVTQTEAVQVAREDYYDDDMLLERVTF